MPITSPIQLSSDIDIVSDLRKYGAVEHFYINSFSELAAISSANTGDIVIWRGTTFVYQCVISGEHLNYTGSGGLKWKVIFGHNGLDPRAIGAPANGTDDDAPYVENAFEISNHVNLSSGFTYVFASVIGLPDQTFYTNDIFQLTGYGATVILDGVTAGDHIFTSAAAKTSPESTDNLYTGKFEIIGINFRQSSASVLINGDRIYNIIIKGNHFRQITSVVKSSRNKGAGYTNGYIQSLTLAHNFFIQVTKIVDAKRCFHFRWDHNYAEACDAGIYIDGSDDAAVVGFSMIGGVFEGGGQAVRLGKVLTGSVKDVYFEANTTGDVVTNKCDIEIGVNGGRSQAFVVSSCTFQPTTSQKADTDYVSIKDNAQPTDTYALKVTDCSTTGTRLFQPDRIREQQNNVIGNNATDGLWNSRSPLPAQSAGVSYQTYRSNKTIAELNSGGDLRIAQIDLTELISRISSATWHGNSNGVIRVDMRFRTAGAIQAASAVAEIEYIVAAASPGVGTGVVSDYYAAFALKSFVQIASGQSIETTYSNTTKEVFGTPTLVVSRAGNVYTLRLSTFDLTGKTLTNYGEITNVDIALTTFTAGARVSSFERGPNIFPTV